MRFAIPTRMLWIVFLVGVALGGMAVGLSLGGGTARAEVRLDITRGKVEPLPIAITEFSTNGGRWMHKPW